MDSLNTNLAKLRAEKDAARDPAITAVMNNATEALRRSDILDGVKSVGDRAPLFARPNIHGKTVRLRSLLKRGPVIVSFFRGRW